jgi:MFS transporter, DHA3 family, macrolide efflux protein
MRDFQVLAGMAGLRTFMLVWLGQWLSWLGSAMASFALGIWLYERTGSPTLFALSVLVSVLPRILLAPLAGPIIDRWDRRMIMIASDLGAGAVTLALALLLWSGQLAVWQVYVGLALGAICGTFQRPAYAASVTQLVPRAQYSRANGLIGFARSSADLLAPVLAGYLIVTAGLFPILLLDLATFIAATITLCLVRYPALSPSAGEDQAGSSLIQEAQAGWRYLRTRPGLLRLLLYAGAGNFLGITAEVLLTPYILTGTSADRLGWIMALAGGGLLFGGALLSIWGGPRQLVRGIFGFELVVCVCSILIGLSSGPWMMGGAVFCYFVAIALSDGCTTALWQAKVAPAFQGRVFALREMISYGALPLGLLVFPPLAELVFEPLLKQEGGWSASLGRLIGSGPGRGIALVFVLAGVVNVLLIGWAWRSPHIRQLEDERTYELAA